MRDFVNFREYLPKALAKYNVSRQSQAALICERFRQLAPKVVGKDAANHVAPKYFKHGVLTISVPSSVWAQHVFVHRHELLLQLNMNLDGAHVKDIRTYVEAV